MYSRKNSKTKNPTGSSESNQENYYDEDSKKRRLKDNHSTIVIVVVSILSMLTLLENTFYSLINTEKIGSKTRKGLLYERGSRRNRRVVLLGPHDRPNDFGDILSERVLSKLLVEHAGYVYDEVDDRKNTILLGGLVTRDDMDRYGLTPGKTVYNMKTIQELSRSDFRHGPYDIVYMGGSSTVSVYEKHRDAVDYLETMELRESARDSKVSDCSYLFPRQLLLPKINKTLASRIHVHETGRIFHNIPRSRTNFAIGASLEHPEGTIPTSCRQALVASKKNVWFRDDSPLGPEHSFMIRELYGNETEKLYENDVKQELLRHSAFAHIKSSTQDLNYIAVQLGSMDALGLDDEYYASLALGLDEVSRNLSEISGDTTIVFFNSGKITRADTGISRKVSEKLTQPFVLYPDEHALKIVALISRANAVISTSRSVRLLSLVYEKPRASLRAKTTQVNKFLDLWEAPDVAALGMVRDEKDLWNQGLQRFFLDKDYDQWITQNQTRVAYETATQLYLAHFDQWSKLLTTPIEDEDDGDDDSVD